MNLFLLLSCVVATHISVHAGTICNACFKGQCYKRTTLFEGYEPFGQLAIDRTENILYFHFETKNSVHINGGFNLDEIKFQLIPEADFTFGRAVDQNTRDLYMTAVNGIYKYNPNTNNTVLYGLNDKTIWQLQYKDKLYYAEFLTNGLFTHENNKSKSITALSSYQIFDFIVDKQDDIYFTNDFTIYRLKKGASKATLFADKYYSLTTDRNGVAYFIQPYTRSIYKLNYLTDQLTEVGAFGSGIAFQVIFDSKNNIIYHDTSDGKLYFLTITQSRCRVSVTTTDEEKETVKIDAA